MKQNPLIKKYGKEDRWVNFVIKTREGKKTKLPYSPITKKLASSTNPKDWTSYDVAKEVSDNVGIVFTPEKTLLGIDIDHCLKNNKINHEQKEIIADLILEADTYTEVSPSGEGLHLLLALSEPLDLVSNKRTPFEAYTQGRYFTFTGKTYGEAKEVRTVSLDEAHRILSIAGYPWKNPVRDIQCEEVRSTFRLSDDQVLEKMFSSKNGTKIKELYEGSLADHNKDASSADMALLSHLAFWTGKDATQMERIWANSPLGSREKTSKRSDYRLRSISNAISACSAIYETPKQKIAYSSGGEDIDLLYITGSKGAIIYLQNTENMCRVLRKHPNFSGRFRYDVFKNTYEIKPTTTNEWRVIEDNDAVNIQTAISIHYSEWFGKVGKLMVQDAMVKVCKENTVDSAKDFITSLVWDEKSRLDEWLTHTYGTPSDVYHQAVASNWIKGLVKRIVEPGCKFDYVLVLEGEQGVRKSTSLAVLGGDWHVETTMSTDSKDFFMQFQGKAIIEFSEGETLNRTEVKRMKAIITMQHDKYRPPYERTSQDFPRRCVFAMTTNQGEYLKDETGNRRWLPVSVVKDQADINWLEENRNQILAEAYHRVINLKETVYEFPKEETLAQQRSRQISDPNTDVIAEWYFDKVSDDDRYLNGITVDRAFKEALHGGFMSKPITKFEQMSIGNIFDQVLKLEKRRVMHNGIRSVRWFGTEAVKEQEENEDAYQKVVRNF